MNEIGRKQNETRQLELLLAQKLLYSKAKHYHAGRVFLALVFAIGGPAVTATNKGLDVYVGVVAIAYLLIDNLILERWESTIRAVAAKVQELFDTNLFDLSWNEYVSGKKPDSETIAEVLETAEDKDYAILRDWYAPDVEKVDLHLGTLICQRSNVWWDTKLRKFYASLVGVILAIVVMLAVVVSVAADLTVAKLIVGIILPILPLIEVSIKQLRDSAEFAEATNELKTNIDSEIEKRFAGQSDESAKATLRVFQDQIFRHRSKCPMVFDWVHRICKNRYENQIRFSVNTCVEKLLQSSKKA